MDLPNKILGDSWGEIYRPKIGRRLFSCHTLNFMRHFVEIFLPEMTACMLPFFKLSNMPRSRVPFASFRL